MYIRENTKFNPNTKDASNELLSSISNNEWGAAKLLLQQQEKYAIIKKYEQAEKTMFGLAKGFINIIELSSSYNNTTHKFSKMLTGAYIHSYRNTLDSVVKEKLDKEFVTVFLGRDYSGRIESIYYKFKKWYEANNIPVNYYFVMVPNNSHRLIEQKKYKIYQEFRSSGSKNWINNIWTADSKDPTIDKSDFLMVE